jgi:hypothetical protein
VDRAVQQVGVHERGSKQREGLRRHAARDGLAHPEKARREPADEIGPARDSFRKPAEQRQRAERDEQRRQRKARDQHRIQRAPGRTRGERCQRSGPDREPRVAPPKPEDHGDQPHQRADRQIDPAGDDDGREREREQADFAGQPHELDQVAPRREVGACQPEHGDDDREQAGERALVRS